MRLLKTTWRRWMRFAEIMGTFQINVMLSVIYFTLMMLFAVPYRIVSDNLALKRPSHSRWIQRPKIEDPLESMRKQG